MSFQNRASACCFVVVFVDKIILNIVKNGGWAHSINVKRIMPNVTKIFVVPNNSVEKNNTSMGIVFIATTNAIQCQSTGMNWESEKVEDGKK